MRLSIIKILVVCALVIPTIASAQSVVFPSKGGTGSTTLSGILKGNGTGAVKTAVVGTDYVTGSGSSGNCVKWGANNLLADQGAACGSGGGGSGGGTWSTTTSTVSGTLINYPNNDTDVVTIGSSATTSAEAYFDPNTNTYKLGTFTGPLQALSGIVSASSTLSIFYGGTGATTIGASSTVGLSNGSKIVYYFLSPANFITANISQWTNDSGYLTSLSGAASSTLLSDKNNFSSLNKFTNSSTTIGSIDTLCLTGDLPCRTTWPTGGGSGTVSTSTNETAGQLPYWTTNSGTPAKLGQVATTTVSCSGAAACTQFVAIGGSPVTITGTDTTASSTLLGDNNTFTGKDTFSKASTTQLTLLGQLYDIANLAGTAGQVLMASGGTNAPRWTSTTTFSTGVTYLNGAVTCDTASASVFGCLTAAKFSKFDSATTTAGTGLTFTLSSNTFNVNTSQSISTLSNLTTNGFVTTSGGTGALSVTTLPIGVASGGTGWAAIAAGSIPYGNGASALSTTTAGTSGFILGLNGTTPTWLATTTFSTGLTYLNGNVTADLGTSVDLASEVTGTLPIARGGTNSTAISSRNLVWFDGTAILATSSTLTVGNLIGTTTATSTFLGSIEVATTSATALSIKDQYGSTVLNVNTSSTTGPILDVQSTTSNSGSPFHLFQVDQYGHLTASSTGAVPTLSCTPTNNGSVGANANDVAGEITTGTLSTSCTVTFGSIYTVTPEVLVTGNSTSATAAVTSKSTTAFTVSLSTGLTGDTISYFVIQP